MIIIKKKNITPKDLFKKKKKHKKSSSITDITATLFHIITPIIAGSTHHPGSASWPA